jgi:hypothetical protein
MGMTERKRQAIRAAKLAPERAALLRAMQALVERLWAHPDMPLLERFEKVHATWPVHRCQAIDALKPTPQRLKRQRSRKHVAD